MRFGAGGLAFGEWWVLINLTADITKRMYKRRISAISDFSLSYCMLHMQEVLGKCLDVSLNTSGYFLAACARFVKIHPALNDVRIVTTHTMHTVSTLWILVRDTPFQKQPCWTFTAMTTPESAIMALKTLPKDPWYEGLGYSVCVSICGLWLKVSGARIL